MRAALAIVRKDIALELRGKEILIHLSVFSILVLTLFSFTAKPGSTALAETAPGILWIAFLFAGTLGLGRTFERERENDCFTGLLLAPQDRVQIYWGKCLSTLIYMVVFQLILWPIFCVLYGYNPVTGALAAWAGFLLGDVGFIALGVILSAVTIHLRSREMVLPLLLLPLCLPVLVGGVRCLDIALSGGEGLGMWLGRLAAFDVIFLSLGTVLFPIVVEE
jgi:heme exporter protein B